MLLRELTNGKTSGTGTISLPSQMIGGVVISTDGTNAATVVIRETGASGKILLDLSTKSPMAIFAPIDASTNTIYYDISGTGAQAEIYMWENRSK